MHLSFSIASINEREKASLHAHPTHESQEYHLMRSYEKALEKMNMKMNQDAYSLFQSVLSHPISNSASLSERGLNFSPVIQIKYLSLKNLGDLLLGMASEENDDKLKMEKQEEALNCFIQALEIDDSDCLLCYRTASIAFETYRLSFARRLLEHCLVLNPRHWGSLNKLLTVLEEIGDEIASVSLARKILSYSPSHPQALKILKSSQTFLLINSNQQKNPNSFSSNTESTLSVSPNHHGYTPIFLKNRMFDCASFDIGMKDVEQGIIDNKGYLYVKEWELISSSNNLRDGRESKTKNEKMISFAEERNSWCLHLKELSWKAFTMSLLEELKKIEDRNLSNEKEARDSKTEGFDKVRFLIRGHDALEFEGLARNKKQCDKDGDLDEKENKVSSIQGVLDEKTNGATKSDLPTLSTSPSTNFPESEIMETPDAGTIKPQTNTLPCNQTLSSPLSFQSSTFQSECNMESNSEVEAKVEGKVELQGTENNSVEDSALKEGSKELNRPRTRLHHAQENPNSETRNGSKQFEIFNMDNILSILEGFVFSIPETNSKRFVKDDSFKSVKRSELDLNNDFLREVPKKDSNFPAVVIEGNEDVEIHSLVEEKSFDSAERIEILEFMKQHSKEQEDICLVAFDLLEIMAKKYNKPLDDDLIKSIIQIERDYLPLSFKKSSSCCLFLSELYTDLYSTDDSVISGSMEKEAVRCMNEIMEDIILSSFKNFRPDDLTEGTALNSDKDKLYDFSGDHVFERGLRFEFSKMHSKKRKGTDCWVKCDKLIWGMKTREAQNWKDGEVREMKRRKRRRHSDMDLGFGLWNKFSKTSPQTLTFSSNFKPNPSFDMDKNSFQSSGPEVSRKMSRTVLNDAVPQYQTETQLSDGSNSDMPTYPQFGTADESETFDFWIRFHWNWGTLFFLKKETDQGKKHFQACERLLEQYELKEKGKEKTIFLSNSKSHGKISKLLVKQKLMNVDLEELILFAERKAYHDELLTPQVVNQLSNSLFPKQTFSAENESSARKDKPEFKTCKSFFDENVAKKIYVFECDKEIEVLENANLKYSIQLKWKSAKLLLHHFYNSSIFEFDFKLVLCCHQQILSILLKRIATELLQKDKFFACLFDESDDTGYGSNALSEENDTEIKNELIDLFAKELDHLCCFSILLYKCNEKLPLAALSWIQRTLICCMQFFLNARHTRMDDLQKCHMLEGVIVDIALAFCLIYISNQPGNADKQVSVLEAMHNLLGFYGLCCKSNQVRKSKGLKNTFLHMAIQHLTVIFFQSNSPLPSSEVRTSETFSSQNEENDLEDKETEKDQVDEKSSEDVMDAEGSINGIRRNLNIDFQLEQCFYCLFGIRLKLFNETNTGEGLMNHKNARFFSFNDKKQCAHFFHYLLPFARSFPKFRLMKLRKFFSDLYAKFPSPPLDFLARHSIEHFLNDVELNDDLLLSQSFLTLFSKMRRICESIGMVKRDAFANSMNELLSFTSEDVGYSENEKQTIRETVVKSIQNQSHVERKESSNSFQEYENHSNEVDVIKEGKYSSKSEKLKDIDYESNNDSSVYDEVYKNLYFLLTEVENMNASNEWGGFILSQEGMTFMQNKTKLFIYDLCFNPMRFKSWMNLGNLYREEYELLLNDSSKQFSVENWNKETELGKRVQTSYKRSYRCILHALSLTQDKNERSDCEETCAFLHYSRIQSVAPIYDGISSNMVFDDVWKRHCLQSLSHFYVASTLSESWIHHLYIAKLKQKLNFPSQDIFISFSNATKLNPTSLDVFYSMHSYRLKLLCKYKAKKPLHIMKIISNYCFQVENLDRVNELLSSDNLTFSSEAKTIDLDSDLSIIETSESESPNVIKLDLESTDHVAPLDSEIPSPDKFKWTKNEKDRSKVWNILFDDAIAAMNICSEGEFKHFHKARYRKALGLANRDNAQDIVDAKNELSFLFSSSKSAFCINVWEIQGKKRSKVKLNTKQVSPTHGKFVKEIFISECSRKFTTCVRKYLLYYLYLCRRLNDFQTLLRCYSNLKIDKKFCHSLGDIASLSLGYYIFDLLNEIERSSAKKPLTQDSGQKSPIQSSTKGDSYLNSDSDPNSTKESSNLLHYLELFAIEVISEHAGNWHTTVVKSLTKSSVFSQQLEYKIFKTWIQYLTHVYASGEIVSIERVIHRLKRKWNRPSKVSLPYVFAIWNDLISTWHVTLSHCISQEFILIPHEIRLNKIQNEDGGIVTENTVSNLSLDPSLTTSLHLSSFFSTTSNTQLDFSKAKSFLPKDEKASSKHSDKKNDSNESTKSLPDVGPLPKVSNEAIDSQKCNSEKSIAFLKSARALWNEISSGPFSLISHPSLSSHSSSSFSSSYPIKFLWSESCCSFLRAFDGRTFSAVDNKPDENSIFPEKLGQVRESEIETPDPLEKLVEKAFMLVHGRFPCEKELMQFKDDHSKSKPPRLRNVNTSNKPQSSQAANLSASQKNQNLTSVNFETDTAKGEKYKMDESKEISPKKINHAIQENTISVLNRTQKSQESFIKVESGSDSAPKIKPKLESGIMIQESLPTSNLKNPTDHLHVKLDSSQVICLSDSE